jgi:hypothetical protein
MDSPVRVKPLHGVIDLHVHCGPDSLPRNIDAVDIALLAKEAGMRGFVVKNHYEPTASLAYMVRKQVPDIEVFGGVTMNLTVGGMNPAAVEHMAKVAGGYGRYVWMGSFDTEAQAKYSNDGRPYVSVMRDQELLPEVKEVIAKIAEYNLVLSTGHSTPEEVMAMLYEARTQGVKHMVVTHAMIAPIHMQVPQMLEAAELGAYIEFVYNGLIGPYKEFEFSDYAAAIRAVGADRCILSTDLGQTVNPVHTDGMIAFLAGLQQLGITEAEVDAMTKENPARILDLEIHELK